jgi:hypothetical protein
VIVITFGGGGELKEHHDTFASYQRRGAEVEIRGPCYSACTIVTSYVAKDKLCIAEGAFLAFHAVRSNVHGEIMPDATAAMYYSFPSEIRLWIDRNGGHRNLPLNGYWTMYDRELWAMGYPKCK